MTRPTDVEAVVRGLSETQRSAVLWCNADGSPREHGKGAPARVSFWSLLNVTKGDPTREVARHYKLIAQGTGENTMPGHIWPEDTWSLTPLGLAVAAHLQEQANGK